MSWEENFGNLSESSQLLFTNVFHTMTYQLWSDSLADWKIDSKKIFEPITNNDI